jgi:nicotinamide mononucleotide (NMN) deamidase PncC
VRRRLGADVGLGVTGVAGPTPQDGERPGTVLLAVAGVPPPVDMGDPGDSGGRGEGGGGAAAPPVLGSRAERVEASSEPGVVVVRVQLPGDRQRIRQFACISLLDLLRRHLLATSPAGPR